MDCTRLTRGTLPRCRHLRFRAQPSSAYVLSGRLGTVAGRLPSWHLHSTIRCRNVSEIASTDSGDIVEGSAGGRTIPATSLEWPASVPTPARAPPRSAPWCQGDCPHRIPGSRPTTPTLQVRTPGHSRPARLSGRLSRHHCLHCDLLVSCRSRASKRASLNGRLHSTRRVQHQGLYPR